MHYKMREGNMWLAIVKLGYRYIYLLMALQTFHYFITTYYVVLYLIYSQVWLWQAAYSIFPYKL